MNKEEIKTRIDYIRRKLDTLKRAIDDYETQTDSFETYKSLKTIERDCEEIVESAIRINQEVLEDTGEIGQTYRESFEKLVELNLFDKDILEKLANTTGFRNRLAHDYMDLDDEITVKTARNILKLYSDYLLKILDYVDN